MSNMKPEEPRRQRSADYLPGVSGNPVAPFQRVYQPGEQPIKHGWIYLVPIGAIVVGGVVAYFIWGQ